MKRDEKVVKKINISKMKENDYKFFLWTTLIIFPIISILIFFYKKNKYKNYVFVSAMVAFYATTLIPFRSYDLTRYYLEYDNLNKSFEFFDYLKGQKDFLFPIITFVGKKINLKKEIIPFISSFFSYFFMLKIFFLIVLKKRIKNPNWTYFFFFLLIDFRTIVFGVRNFLAVSVLLYGIYGLYTRKNKLIYIFLAPIIHVMTAVYIPIIFIHKIICEKRNYFSIIRKLFLLSFFAILISPTLIIETIQKIPLPEIISNHINHYLTGFWSGKHLEELGSSFRIFSFLSSGLKKYLVLIFLIINPIKIKKTNTKKLYSLVYFITIFPNILWNNPGLGARYYGVSFILLAIVVLIHFIEEQKSVLTKKNYIWILSLFLIIVIGNLAMVYEMRETLINSVKNSGNFIIHLLFNSIEYRNFL